jgi:hypothetical protein
MQRSLFPFGTAHCAIRTQPTSGASERFVCLPVLIAALLLAGCSTPVDSAPPACGDDQIRIIPTATRQTDPDLFNPPAPPPDGGDAAEYCPTPVPAETPVAEYPTQFITTQVANLSLDVIGQELAAVAAGDDMLAVAWIARSEGESEVYVALSRGGNHFQVRRVDSGNSVSLAFSKVNRLHMAYEQDGQILYRAADQGTHPADVAPIRVEDAVYSISSGRNPQVVVDELNWAHVLYEQEGSIYKAKHLSNDSWLTQFVAYGTDMAVRPFYNEKELVLFGIPTGTYWFGILMAAPYNGQVRVFRYLSWFNLWEHVASFPIPPGESLTGPVGLDYLAASEEEAWVYAAWVTERPSPEPPMPLYAQPLFEAVNPLFPDQIANPTQIYQGLNAVRWRTFDTPFSAGLKQTISVSNPGSAVNFSAWGLADTVPGADLTLRVGIDPTGGGSPDSSSVVWSDPITPATFTRLAVSAPAAGGTATLFLHATLNTTGVPGTAVWDAAAVQNGGLANGDFEGPFTMQSTLKVPEGWTPYYQDSGNNPISGRDRYTVYAAWSENGGSAWVGPEAITANRDLSGGTTGAIRPDVIPVASMATEAPSVSFFYIYETGDPPPGTTFLRFGRPSSTVCDLGTTDCTDTPGLPLLPRNVVRPSYRLLSAPDPFNPDRALLAWDSLQTDTVSRDVYASYLVLR